MEKIQQDSHGGFSSGGAEKGGAESQASDEGFMMVGPQEAEVTVKQFEEDSLQKKCHLVLWTPLIFSQKGHQQS